MKMDYTKFQEVLTRLDGIENKGSDQYMALCPAHNDKNPSLSVAYKDGKLL
jgi:DNA primase